MLARLKALRRELIEPAIADARGRVIKMMGDGIVVELSSTVDAVDCAIDVHRGIMRRIAGLDQEQGVEVSFLRFEIEL
jgi:adenylate cyclase